MARVTNSVIMAVMPIQEKCRILSHQKIAPGRLKLGLSSAYISSHASAGQFVNIRCSGGLEPLLRRPFSLHRIKQDLKLFEVLYEVKGQGTEALSRHSVGEELDILGPLGTGFDIDSRKQIAILVAGGIGVAPLLALAEAIKSTSSGIIYALIGSKNRSGLLCEDEFKQITSEVMVATEDGTHGRKGMIADLLQDLLNNTLSQSHYGSSRIFACGPRKMLRAVAEIAFQKKIECRVSMEERMACGIGACKGCAVQTRNGYKMVCKDGPVFASEEIIW